MKRSAALALALTLLLAGCGREMAVPEAAEDASPQAAPETVTANADPVAVQGTVADNYVGRALPLPEGVETVTCLAAWGEDIFLYGGEGGAAALYVTDTDGAVQYTYPLLADKGTVTDLAPSGDGQVWVLTCRTEQPEDPALGPVFLGGSVCCIRPGEGVMTDFDLPEQVEAASALRVDPAREMVYVQGTGKVYGLDAAGAVRFMLPAGQIACTREGDLAAVEGLPDGTSVLRVLDPESQSWGFSTPLGEGYYTLYDGWGSRDLYLSDGEKLYGLDLKSNTMTPLANWLDAGVSAVFAMDALADGSLAVLDRSTPRLLTVQSREQAAQGPETVTLAVAGDPGILERSVLGFNNAQDDYRVSIRDYRDYGDTALEQLGLDIASGSGPDLLDMRALPAERCARKGVLEDLYPYLDADADLHREDMRPELLAAMETEGHLYEFIPMVSVLTAVTTQETYDSLEGWRYSAMTPDKGVTVLPGGVAAGSDRYNFLLQAVCGAGSPFIDWENAACDFDNEEFRAVLAIAAQLNDGSYGTAAEVPERSVSLGGNVWAAWELAQSLAWEGEAFGGEMPCMPGLPGRDGQSRYLLCPVGEDLSISAGAQNKEGAWAFLRYCMMEQEGDVLATPLWTKHTPTAQPPTWESMGVTDPAPYEQAMEELLSAATGLWHIDQAVMDIVLDETAAYFAGEVTAEAASAGVQARVSLYVAEQS